MCHLIIRESSNCFQNNFCSDTIKLKAGMYFLLSANLWRQKHSADKDCILSFHKDIQTWKIIVLKIQKYEQNTGTQNSFPLLYLRLLLIGRLDREQSVEHREIQNLD